jgi:hypothetical protein
MTSSVSVRNLERLAGTPALLLAFAGLFGAPAWRSEKSDQTNQIAGIEAGSVSKRLDHFPITLFVSVPTSGFRKAWRRRVQVPFALPALLSLGAWVGCRYTPAASDRVGRRAPARAGGAARQ